MRQLWGALLCALVTLAFAGSAWAATVTGSVTDPQDVKLRHPDTGNLMPDVKSVTATYNDSADGHMIVQFTLWRGLQASYYDPNDPYRNREIIERYLNFKALLSAPSAAGCEGDRQDMRIDADNYQSESW